MVEHSAHFPMTEGSNPAPGTRKEKMIVKYICLIFKMYYRSLNDIFNSQLNIHNCEQMFLKDL